MLMTDAQIINIFQDFEGMLNIKWFLPDLVNWVFWQIVKFILWLVHGMEGLWREMFKLFGIFGDSGFQGFLNQFKPLVFTIAVLSIIIFFLRYMKDPNVRLRSLFDTLLIGLALFTVFPLAITTLGNELQKLSNADRKSQEISYQLVNQYIHDIDVFDKTNWADPKMSLERYKTHIEAKETIINDTNIEFLDILENYADSRNGIQKKTREILNKKKSLNANGNPTVVNKGQGFFGAGREEYYRYSVNYFMIIPLLIFLAVVFALSAIKTVKMIYQLITTAVITFTLVFKDMEDGGVVKKGMRNMLGNVMQLVFIYFSMELFVILIGFLQKQMSGFGYLLAVAGISLATLDGSFFLQELTGIESGFKSIGQTLQSIYHGSRLLSGIGRGIGNAVDFAKNTTKQGAKGLGGVIGFGQGLIDGGETAKQNLDTEKHNANEERQKEYGNSNLSTDKDNLSNTNLDSDLHDTDTSQTLDDAIASQPKTAITTEHSENNQLQTESDNSIIDRQTEYGQADDTTSLEARIPMTQDVTADNIPTQILSNQVNDNKSMDSQLNGVPTIVQDKLDAEPQIRLGNAQSILTNVQPNQATKYDLPKQPVPDFKPAQDKVRENEKYAQQREIQENKTLTAVTKEKIEKSSDKAIDRYINSPTLNQARDNAMIGRKVGRLVRGLFSKRHKG